MEPFEALATLASDHRVRFDGSPSLAAAVREKTPSSRLRPAMNLDGDQVMTPDTVLSRLALSTPLDLLDDPFHLFRRWAALKYLGAFESVLEPFEYHPRLGLSTRTRKVRANQRRVFSEELGIGFAIEAGVRWLANGIPDSIIRTVDVDNIEDTIPGIAGLITSSSNRRPDYIQLRSVPFQPNILLVTALEAKGSKFDNQSLLQLGNASEQLDALTIGGTPVPGLASAAVLNDWSVKVNVLETSWPAGDPLPAVDAAHAFERGPRDGGQTIETFTAAALVTSWATQAAVVGNEAAYRRWSPQRRDERRLPPRDVVQTDVGPIAGVRYVAPILGGLIEAVIGLPVDLDDVLTEAPPEYLLSAQAQRARELRATLQERRTSAGDEPTTVLSSTSDGLVMTLRAL
ncbi:hypothetical protein [Leifsonia aquatica]|uniref:Uncharacterized protein n=2 Tax=Leifsonia aquatica TaxID=144185 RepID=U2RWV9_LEIAQ|nr:hypothetical protein [Leifsonia aquatica]ERK73256.1 hypothetical protein N136_00382 [Leifsonia aquatica ATCC 14665]MBB2967516.1 hypothetical protein [Leifsonia aquatica]